jgi:predicted DNA-binding transcriptional regulator YafY
MAVSTGKLTKSKVDPYQVWVMDGGFYLIAFCNVRNAVRTFAIDRIKGYSVTDESFEMSENFKLEDYLQTVFRVMRGKPEKVTFRVNPGAAHVVRERIWHPAQELREQPDGGVQISVEVPINYEIISWIMGFGSAAEVTKPESLRKQLRAEFVKAANYSGFTTVDLFKNLIGILGPDKRFRVLVVWMKSSIAIHIHRSCWSRQRT